MWEAIAANRRRSFIMLFVLALLLVALGFFVGGTYAGEEGGMLGLGGALVLWFFLWLIAAFQGDSIILGTMGAREIEKSDAPQLWNVVRGDMSLVGPRPPLPEEVQRYNRWQRRRLSMKPGITCLWQVSGRHRLSFETWMKMDLQYIDNWSLMLDFQILARTFFTVITGQGAM